MIKYLVILLDDVSTSFCHYVNTKKDSNLISIDRLKAGVRFAMKENCIIQYVLPDYQLPDEYMRVIEEMNHVNIVSSKGLVYAEAVVINGFDEMSELTFKHGVSYILRTDFNSFIDRYGSLKEKLEYIDRLNIVYTDVEKFTDDDVTRYREALTEFSVFVRELAAKDCYTQINILTDRMFLNKMNNCNAGAECITLAPDGKFYVCPGFYYDGMGDLGSLEDGVNIRNPHLYILKYAPICRICDSYHCKRCVWLNRKLTLEVNTPSYQQCVMSHLERNASSATLPEIHYLDPLDKLIK